MSGGFCECLFDQQTIATLETFVSVLFFGSVFVSMRAGMLSGVIGPLTFNAARYVISFLIVAVVQSYMLWVKNSEKIKNDNNPADDTSDISSAQDTVFFTTDRLNVLKWGFIVGVANFGASATMLMGLVTETAGESAFIIGMYVVLTPIGMINSLFLIINSPISCVLFFRRVAFPFVCCFNKSKNICSGIDQFEWSVPSVWLSRRCLMFWI